MLADIVTVRNISMSTGIFGPRTVGDSAKKRRSPLALIVIRAFFAPIVLAAALALSGCVSDANSARDINATQNVAADEAAAQTPEESRDARLTVAVSGASDFVLVRSDYTSDEYMKIAVRLKKAIEAEYGLTLAIQTDWKNNPVHPHEIIVGKTEREKTEGVEIDRTALGKNGFVIKAAGGKIFVAGGSEGGTSLAVDYFIENLLRRDGVFISVDYEHIVYQEYDIGKLLVDGKEISGFKLVYEKPEYKKAAELLRDNLYEKSGVMLEITDAAQSGPAIILSAKPAVKGVITAKVGDGSLVFASGAEGGMEVCVRAFVKRYIEPAFGGTYNFGEKFEYAEMGDHIVIEYLDE